MYWDAYVHHHLFLISATEGGEKSVSCMNHFNKSAIPPVPLEYEVGWAPELASML